MRDLISSEMGLNLQTKSISSGSNDKHSHVSIIESNFLDSIPVKSSIFCVQGVNQSPIFRATFAIKITKAATKSDLKSTCASSINNFVGRPLDLLASASANIFASSDTQTILIKISRSSIHSI